MSAYVIDRLNAALGSRYRVERKLGEGGMATVYLADDVKHEREVALKVLKPELAAVVGAERFLAEIKTTANLQHPHGACRSTGTAGSNPKPLLSSGRLIGRSDIGAGRDLGLQLGTRREG